MINDGFKHEINKKNRIECTAETCLWCKKGCCDRGNIFIEIINSVPVCACYSKQERKKA
jgi:hypothetical protein